MKPAARLTCFGARFLSSTSPFFVRSASWRPSGPGQVHGSPCACSRSAQCRGRGAFASRPILAIASAGHLAARDRPAKASRAGMVGAMRARRSRGRSRAVACQEHGSSQADSDVFAGRMPARAPQPRRDVPCSGGWLQFPVQPLGELADMRADAGVVLAGQDGRTARAAPGASTAPPSYSFRPTYSSDRRQTISARMRGGRYFDMAR